MFTVEVRINGSLISHVYGHNEGAGDNGQDKYRYEYYEPETRQLVNGKVQHKRSEGIRMLVAKILTDANKSLIA